MLYSSTGNRICRLTTWIERDRAPWQLGAGQEEGGIIRNQLYPDIASSASSLGWDFFRRPFLVFLRCNVLRLHGGGVALRKKSLEFVVVSPWIFCLSDSKVRALATYYTIAGPTWLSLARITLVLVICLLTILQRAISYGSVLGFLGKVWMP